MLIVTLLQTLFGFAALAACAMASRHALQRHGNIGLDLILAGTFAFIFYLSLEDVRYELLAVSVLAIVAGWLLAPRPAHPPLDIGDDSTIRRRVGR